MSTIEKIKRESLERENLRKRLNKKYGVEGNRKNIKCFSLAWKYGHFGGFQEVEIYFVELVELIK